MMLTEDDICVYCLAELAAGVPEDGHCGHEDRLARDRQARDRIRHDQAAQSASP